MANLIVSAVSTFDNKGLKKGKKEVSAFDKQIKTFGKTFAAAFSVTKLASYGKAAVKAFIADEKAAKSLEQQLKNTGFYFSSPSVENYISKLQTATGVLDDELRPAFQQLLTITGSITKSQDALNTAINTSAATGASLAAVTSALSRGFAGNTTSLGKLNAGLSKATLKSGDMDKILAKLNDKFRGQAQARLSTYAGKMDLLKVASENVKEEIGKGILGALDALSKDASIENTTTKMEDFGKATGEAITGVGVLIAELSKIPGAKKGTNILFGTNIFGLLGKLAEEEAKSKAGSKPNLEPRSASRVYLQQLRLETTISKKLAAAKAAELAAAKAKTAVDQLKDKFDLERIGFTLALNEATDAETKLRIRAQLAILDNNEALAKKILAEMNGTTAIIEVTKQFYALSEATRQLLLAFGVDPSQMGAAGTILGGAGGRGNIANLANVAINNPAFASSAAGMDLGLALGFTPGTRAGGGGAPPAEIIVTVNTAAGSDRLSQAIAESIQIATKNGYSTVPAGQGF